MPLDTTAEEYGRRRRRDGGAMGGLLGLLDDVIALVRLAAASADDVASMAGKATAKAAGVLVDDAAVTPQYVRGIAAQRELPIIAAITKGSLRNKFLFVLPALLLLSTFASFLLTPLLMLGGLYLVYEGAHSLHGKLSGHGKVKGHEVEVVSRDEKQVVADAVRTDLILSAEIMTIALKEVGLESGLVQRAAVLAVVAVVITVLVYGVVALIVKADDVGLALIEDGGARERVGRRLVAAMPAVMTALAWVGTFMLLAVGGHLFYVGLHEFGVDVLYDVIHGADEAVRDAAGAAGGFLGWGVDTLLSAVVGLALGWLVLTVKNAVTKGGPAHG
jgi:uncharacterized protein